MSGLVRRDGSVGFVGAGRIARALVARMAAVGDTGRRDVVVSNRRGPRTLAALAAEHGVRAGTIGDAAAADVVFLCVPWPSVPAALGVVGDWCGKVLVDTTNPIVPPAFRVADLGGRTSSEVVAGHAPGAHLVKAFNTLPPELLAEPAVAGGRRVIVYSGDHDDAKQVLVDLLGGWGFAGIDLGGLVAGGALQQFPGGPFPTLDLVRF